MEKRISQHLVELLDLSDWSTMRLTLQGFNDEREIIAAVRLCLGKPVSRIQKLEDEVIDI